ncbi:hypothetical protein RhiirA1_477030 [Rhizophagus irregularis]|uniref:Uncharacterized protein n=1 Tax=Rhizophagus irregularis TaxID=588596 RepID=A0A2N0QUA3_9GLOM|nr:hypothetical protein RhiirA1_477030 [Rhizophagus irregularis]
MFNYIAINRRKDFTQYTYLSIVHKYYLFFMLIYYYGVVTCEADCPDTYNVNRYVQNSKFNESKDAHELLSNYKRFPTWMWRNYQKSMEAVIHYLEGIDLKSAEKAKNIALSCEKEAVRVLADMVKRWAKLKKQLGDDEIDELLAAKINAIVVKDSEEYYRTMIGAEWNIGQLARERFGMDKGYNIGFTTHNGSGLYILQCSCESDIKLKSFLTRKNCQMYAFVDCLAFAKIKKNVALDSYLEHLDASQVHPAAILEDNMKFIELNLRGNVLIDNIN